MNSICQGCRATFAPLEDPYPFREGGKANVYGVASPECFATFCTVLAKERQWASYPPIHRLLVDAYAVQHPQRLGLQKQLGIKQSKINASIQSVIIHLIALYCAFEKNIPLDKIAKTMNKVLASGVQFELTPLESPKNLRELTIADVAKATNFEEYKQLVTKWAQSAWKAWSKHHDTIRKWYEKYATQPTDSE